MRDYDAEELADRAFWFWFFVCMGAGLIIFGLWATNTYFSQ